MRPPALPTPVPPSVGWLLVVAAYTVGALVFLWPLPTAMGSHIWGDRFDAWTTLWLMEHLHRHVADGTLTAVTDEILYPVGYNLWSFGHAALQALGVGLMLLGVPLVWAYNLLLVLGVATSGLAAHLLGRALGGGHAGGFVAGVVFGTSPYLYGEGAAGCVELVSAGFLPLYAWTLVELVRAPGPRRAAASAAALAVIGPFNWYYTLFAGMLGLGFLAWRLVLGERRVAGWILAGMVAAAATNAPLIPLVRRETPTRPTLASALLTDAEAWRVKNQAADGRVDLRELTEPVLEAHDAMQVIENSTTLESLVDGRFTVNPLTSTPGMLAFAVAAAGFAAAGRRGLGWAAIGGVATLLTLGPFLRVDDTPPLPAWSVDHPLPYYFAYEYVPFFSKAYRPYRISVIASTCFAALGATGFAVARLEWTRGVAALVAGALAAVGFTQPLWAGDRPARRPLSDASIPGVYDTLAELPAGGVIELPVHYQPLTVANARLQYNQLRHRHPVLNCNQLIRRTDLAAFRGYVDANPFLAGLVDLGRRSPPWSIAARDVAAAVADGFRYVVFHRRAEADTVGLAGHSTGADLVGQPAWRMLREVFGEPVAADADADVFALPAVAADPDRVWTWSGADVRALELPVDALALGLPLTLPAGGELPLWSGPAREVVVWALGDADAGALSVRVRAGEATRETPVTLSSAHWSWIQVPVEEEGGVEVSLVAGDAPVTLSLTRGQVTLREVDR